ncbi:SRPBCC family protein [Rummeliibacillus sp. JY-2-4R]
MDMQVTTKLKIAKPVNEVFEAIVDPQKMANYWFSSGSERVEKDKRITWKYDEYDAEVTVYVLEVEDNEKIIFKWGSQEEETVVTIAFTHSDNNNTIIEVTESGFKEGGTKILNKMIGQKEGWVYMLTCLKAYLENGINNLRASLVF